MVLSELYTKRCCITIVFQLCFRKFHWEGPRKQVGLKLNGTHQLLVYTDDVNLLGDNRYSKEKHRNSNRC
jgi:hypothetical protein